MHRIKLINMPFADIKKPSIALTQLKYKLSHIDGLKVDIHYFNHDFAKLFSVKTYNVILDQYITGLGDWLFRHIAFPDTSDNSREYLLRHYPNDNGKIKEFTTNLSAKRTQLEGLLDELIDKHELLDADVIGFTSMFSQNNATFALARKLKQKKPEITTLMGGCNCETPMGLEIIKNVSQMDYVFSGPSLISFPELIKNFIDGNLSACNNIPGVFTKNNAGEISGNNLFGDELSINYNIPLDYADFISSYNRNFPDLKNKKIILFETSRGCWWGQHKQCKFCGLNGKLIEYRAMDETNAVKCFNSIFKYSNDCSYFHPVDNILPKHYLKNVFPKLTPPSHINIFYEVHARLTEEDMIQLKKMKINSIQPGLESLNTGILKLMNKGTNVFTNLKCLKNCLLYDVFPLWNLLIGFPFEEEEEVYKKYLIDIPNITHLPPPTGCFPIRFDRYSPYFTQAEEYDLDLQPYDFYRYIYPFRAENLNNIAYYFQDRNYNSQYFKVMVKWIGKLKKLVQSWIESWINRQTLHPELYFESGNIIFDSRFSKKQNYEPSPLAVRILDVLEKAMSLPSLYKALHDVSESKINAELDFLNERKLLFAENDLYMSLVLKKSGSKFTEQIQNIIDDYLAKTELI